MNNQQGPTVEHMELYSMFCGNLDGRGFGGEWIHVYVWLSPFTVHLKPSQHCYSAIPQYKIKKFFLSVTVMFWYNLYPNALLLLIMYIESF